MYRSIPRLLLRVSIRQLLIVNHFSVVTRILILLFHYFIFRCPSGTDGKQCETAPERCIGSPCMHGGKCQDFGSGLNCTCSLDYTGIGCQYEFDACEAGLCQNGATCIDEGEGYTCTCAPGFTGKNCDEDIIDCKENSCPPSATCIDLPGRFYCQCPFNLTGDDCRKSELYNFYTLGV